MRIFGGAQAEAAAGASPDLMDLVRRLRVGSEAQVAPTLEQQQTAVQRLLQSLQSQRDCATTPLAPAAAAAPLAAALPAGLATSLADPANKVGAAQVCSNLAPAIRADQHCTSFSGQRKRQASLLSLCISGLGTVALGHCNTRFCVAMPNAH